MTLEGHTTPRCKKPNLCNNHTSASAGETIRLLRRALHREHTLRTLLSPCMPGPTSSSSSLGNAKASFIFGGMVIATSALAFCGKPQGPAASYQALSGKFDAHISKNPLTGWIVAHCLCDGTQVAERTRQRGPGPRAALNAVQKAQGRQVLRV